MEIQEVKNHFEALFKEKTKYYWIYIVLSALIGGVGGYLSSYASQKGENWATKQDIEEITRKIEEVKKNTELAQSLEIEKRKLKYEAILSALNLIDAHFSHVLTENNPKLPVKQYSTTVEARKCHNNLILSIDNPKIIEVFLEIFFPDESDKTPPTDKLNEFRNLVRAELGYGNPLQLNREKAWFGRAGFEKK
ncbi:MAG: hypothetical protein IPN26_02360 [Bacteroidetes bacterium]|nr:hypothetical protein [Bacteroidota bacterium]